MSAPTPDRLAFLDAGRNRLDAMEQAQIRFIQSTFEQPLLDRIARFLQRLVGVFWIHHSTRHLRHIHGLDNLPELDPKQSYLVVSNHRSFFDQYVITADLMWRGMRHRIVFPVRANFFYDSVAGFLVNGFMSFFSMYPPLFRERSKAVVNVASLVELGRLLRRGGMFAGIHPEGTRGTGPDPYELLPAQPGVGRIIYEARCTVVPVFINGLVNDFKKQITSNFDRTGTPIHVVYGKPIDFGDMLESRPSPRLYRALSERCLEEIKALGQEEKALRAQADS